MTPDEEKRAKLISAARIIDVPKDDWAVVEVLEKYQPLYAE